MNLLIKLAVAILLIATLLGVGTQIGHQHGTIGDLPGQSLVIPQAADAACNVSISVPVWYINGYHGSMAASGCGTITLQACLQNLAGTVYACNTWSGSGSSVRVWSLPASGRMGCTQRTWGWSSLYGTWVTNWVAVCG